MKKVIFLFFACLLALGTTTQAQYNDVIKTQINDALVKYMKDVSPPKGCECNACKFKYANSMKIEKTKKYEGKLLVWGKAKAGYKSTYNGAGTKAVDFYAELQKFDAGIKVIKLKWKANSCMKLTTLFGR